MAEKVNKTEEQAQGAAPAAPVQEEKKPQKQVVTVAFRDIDNFDKEFAVGDDVSHFTSERRERLLKLGYIKDVDA